MLAGHRIQSGTGHPSDEGCFDPQRERLQLQPTTEHLPPLGGGVASLGGRAHYVGKVRNDELGEVFAHDLRSTGVGFDTPPATSGPPTGRCLILVTPGAQRTSCLGSLETTVLTTGP